MRLKQLWLVAGAVGIAAFVLASAAAQAEVKVGYIDPDRILTSYKPYQDAQKEYMSYESELERDYRKQENELKKMQEDYERKALLMSEQRKQEEQRAILKKQEELQRFLSEIGSQQGKLARKNQELSAPILAKVNEVVQRVAKENGYDFVLNTTALAYANEAHDLTEEVTKVLEKELEAEQEQREQMRP